ncbi:membrane-spanning 4-domains subfamily A member 6A-like isoform X1 [Tachyglossus aculeatus]|uniref:membrane-spanning 4-domains subfamily A member 6A-like isoform X1 n=1 Tax=Tachyglossus aculeatus TaxID=9261 RepID=UPI0018F6E577|nr:membrane-spanning 4-domains subfamily A member 6A-like isoform X1 [Tachyglossus aculeatus]
MESQPMPNGVFISFTQPGSHILQPGQSVTSGSSNQPNGTLQKFLKGEPKVLGAFQILIALVTFSCGIIMITSSYLPYELLSGYSLCGSIFFIISGTLSIAAEKKTHKMSGSRQPGNEYNKHHILREWDYRRLNMSGHQTILNAPRVLYLWAFFCRADLNYSGILHHDVPLRLRVQGSLC